MNPELQAALDQRYASVSTALRQRTLALVTARFDALAEYRSANAAAFVEQILPAVLGAQEQMGALTDAYLSEVIGDMLGTTAAPQGVELAQALRGTPAEEVYARPFTSIWTALSDGKPLTQAVAEGRQRLVSITGTDLQLARTQASRQVLAADGRCPYYRRVLRGSHNCAMCTIASTQRYKREKLMPIHPGCDCGVKPLPGDAAPVIDPDLLEAAHAAVAKGTGASDRGGRTTDYRDVIITREHGELGPLLAVRRQNFTGPADIPGQ